jgi:phosphonate transport system ATP-binding protein
MRRKIGFIYQQHYLVSSMSVLANTLSGALGRWGLANTLVNLVHPRRAEIERAEECLEAVGLKEKRRYRCDQLSGGQQQRLAIARTLMQKPEVILADEPVASLDPSLSDEVLELLVRLADDAKLTLVISLHQVELAQRHAQRIVALRDGQIAFDISAGELDRGKLNHLYRSSRDSAARAGVQAEEHSTGGHGGIQFSKRRPCIR